MTLVVVLALYLLEAQSVSNTRENKTFGSIRRLWRVKLPVVLFFFKPHRQSEIFHGSECSHVALYANHMF